MNPEAWNDIMARQAQISKLVEYKSALSRNWMSHGALFFACGT